LQADASKILISWYCSPPMKSSFPKVIFLFLVLGSSLHHLRANDEKALFEKIESVPILDSNNKADRETGLGAVKDPFCMGKYKVTAQQYVEFLNSVAKKKDPYELFDERMEHDPAVSCIKRAIDDKGLFSYQAISGREDFPITYVDLFCCLRFCNWLSHGSPSDAESSEVTETGAYTIETTGDDHEEVTIEASAGSPYFLPTEDQWYKAAYYHHHPEKIISYDPESPIPSVQDSDSFLYWNYPTQTMSEPWNGLGSSSEAANYCRENQWWYSKYTTGGEPFLTPVGFFKNTPGPYGTFDMGGDVSEWTYSLNDIERSSGISKCFVRGGSWASGAGELHRSKHTALEITTRNKTTGFRIASKTLSQVKSPISEDLTGAIIANTIDSNKTYRSIAEFSVMFIGQEAFEMALIYNAVEGGKTCAYLKIMLPVGALTTLIDGALFGFDNAVDWAIQWFLHMGVDTLCLMAIDRVGIQKAKEFAIEWGLQEVVNFYEMLHEGCHTVLDPCFEALDSIKKFWESWLIGNSRSIETTIEQLEENIPTQVVTTTNNNPGEGWGLNRHKHTGNCNH